MIELIITCVTRLPKMNKTHRASVSLSRHLKPENENPLQSALFSCTDSCSASIALFTRCCRIRDTPPEDLSTTPSFCSQIMTCAIAGVSYTFGVAWNELSAVYILLSVAITTVLDYVHALVLLPALSSVLHIVMHYILNIHH